MPPSGSRPWSISAIHLNLLLFVIHRFQIMCLYVPKPFSIPVCRYQPSSLPLLPDQDRALCRSSDGQAWQKTHSRNCTLHLQIQHTKKKRLICPQSLQEESAFITLSALINLAETLQYFSWPPFQQHPLITLLPLYGKHIITHTHNILQFMFAKEWLMMPTYKIFPTRWAS